MARALGEFRTLLLWCVWLALSAVWFTTLWAHWQTGDRLSALFALAVVALLVVLYFAEGIELAATDLLDKEPEQLRRAETRSVLADIQQRSAFFYAQRQVFVVVIIAFMSLITAYSWIYLPFLGRTSAFNLPFWFSLVFTTLTVLWFCQVTPKRLAVLNSELFLAQSSFVWRLIKLIGALGLPNPSDTLVSLIEQHSGYGRRRQLLPSRAAHYALATHLEGLSLDRVLTTIEVDGKGGGRIVRKMLVLLLPREQQRVQGEIDIRAPFIGSPRVTLLALHVLPLSERLDSLAPQLDEHFEGRASGDSDGPSPNLLSEWEHCIEAQAAPLEGAGGARATWRISGGRLPDHPTPRRQDAHPEGWLGALLYQVEADAGEGGLSTEADEGSWSETILEPCRRYSLRRRGQPSLPDAAAIQQVAVAVRAGTMELPEESARCTQLARQQPDGLDLSYPLHGGRYTIHWRLPTSGRRD